MPWALSAAAFEPNVRLGDDQESNRGCSGRSMGIARNIIQAHGESIAQDKRPQGGLVVTAHIPALPQQAETA